MGFSICKKIKNIRISLQFLYVDNKTKSLSGNVNKLSYNMVIVLKGQYLYTSEFSVSQIPCILYMIICV
jgi:hypothetical protein